MVFLILHMAALPVTIFHTGLPVPASGNPLIPLKSLTAAGLASSYTPHQMNDQNSHNPLMADLQSDQDADECCAPDELFLSPAPHAPNPSFC